MAPPGAAGDVPLEQRVPRVHALGRELREHPPCVVRRPARGVHLDELGEEELIALEPVYPQVDMDLAAESEGLEAGAGGEEGGEGGGVHGDAAVLEVVEDGEGLLQLAEAGEALDVLVDGVGVLRMEGERVREGVRFGKFGGFEGSDGRRLSGLGAEGIGGRVR